MNLMLSDLVWLFGVGLLLWLWWHNLQARELALSAVKRHCAELDLQMLDHAVALGKLGLRRGADGRLRVRRIYTFEFSSTGDERYHGEVETLGPRVHTIRVEPHRLRTQATGLGHPSGPDNVRRFPSCLESRVSPGGVTPGGVTPSEVPPGGVPSGGVTPGESPPSGMPPSGVPPAIDRT